MYIEMGEGLYSVRDVNFIYYSRSDDFMVVALKNDPNNPNKVTLEGNEADRIWKIFTNEKNFCVCGEYIFNLKSIKNIAREGENTSISFYGYSHCKPLVVLFDAYDKLITAKQNYENSKDKDM